MSYAAIAQQIVESSRARGFVVGIWSDFPIRLRGMDREISELVEAMQIKHERERIQQMSLESADVVAYALLMMHDMGNTQWHFRKSVNRKPPAFATATEMVAPLREYSDRAYEAWRIDRINDALVSLELLVAHVEDLRTRCLRVPNDLHFDLQLCLAKNRLRAPRHGGKNERS